MATSITYTETPIWDSSITYVEGDISSSSITYLASDLDAFLWEENNLVWQLALPWKFSNIASTIIWNDAEV